MTDAFEGGCACGAVRFRMTARPMFVHCCHCLDCQRQTGSAFVLNGLVETDRIEILQGVPEPDRMPTDSGHPHDIYRCPDCGVALWSDYGARPWLRFVRLGALDEPHAFRPDVHIFVRSKVPWVRIPEDQPSFEVFYDLARQWPAESIARRDAARASA